MASIYLRKLETETKLPKEQLLPIWKKAKRQTEEVLDRKEADFVEKDFRYALGVARKLLGKRDHVAEFLESDLDAREYLEQVTSANFSSFVNDPTPIQNPKRVQQKKRWWEDDDQEESLQEEDDEAASAGSDTDMDGVTEAGFEDSDYSGDKSSIETAADDSEADDMTADDDEEAGLDMDEEVDPENVPTRKDLIKAKDQATDQDLEDENNQRRLYDDLEEDYDPVSAWEQIAAEKDAEDALLEAPHAKVKSKATW